MTSNRITWNNIRSDILTNPEIKAEYDAYQAEFNIARQVIALRASTGLTQREFAQRLGIKQPQLARIESGKQTPTLETLVKLAAGAGYTLELNFIPSQGKKPMNPLKLSSKSLEFIN